MKAKHLFKTQIMIIALALLGGCSPAPIPVSTEPVTMPSAITPESISNTITPLPIPNTTTPLPATNSATPAPSVKHSDTPENPLLFHILSGHSKRVLDVAFSAGGEFLASSSQDLKIKLWDVENGQEVHSFQMRSVDMADIEIFIEGNLLASGEAIWDLESMQEMHVLERGSPYPASVAFSPDGAVLALGLFE